MEAWHLLLTLTKYYRETEHVWCCEECPCAFGCLATSFCFLLQAEDKAAAREEAEAKEKAAAKEAEKESKAVAAKTDKEAKKGSKSIKEDKAPAKSKV